MSLALKYDRYRQRTLDGDRLVNTGWFLLSLLLLLAAGGATYLAALNRMSSAVVGLAGLMTLIFILTTALTLSDLLATRAERPADPNTIRTLMFLVEQLGNRQEFKDEIARLIREQGELYQYQAYALILATKHHGISPEEMDQLTRQQAVRKQLMKH